jgi:hypothetical protein
MATPGDFGGGSIGPDQIFLGITRAPPSAPGRGRAQSHVRQKSNPQATKHERQTRAARIEGFLSAIDNRKEHMSFLQATSEARKPAPHMVPGRSPPAGSAEGRSDGPKLGGRQRSMSPRAVLNWLADLPGTSRQAKGHHFGPRCLGSPLHLPAPGPVGLCTNFVAMPVSSKNTRFKAHWVFEFWLI